MATAGEVAQRALKKILVQSGDAPLQPDEYADFFEDMNHYMSALEATGIRLGYTNVDNVSDEMTVPPGAIRGIIANMAVEAASDYNVSVSPSLGRQAQEGLKAMRRLGQNLGRSFYPQNLPRGSGNDNVELNYTAFYGTADTALLTLSNNTRAATTVSTDVAVRVQGFWSVEYQRGFLCDVTGRVENATDHDIEATITFAMTATGNSTYTFRLMKNGVSQATVAAVLTSTAADVALSAALTILPGEYLELWVEDDLATATVTVVSAQFKVV